MLVKETQNKCVKPKEKRSVYQTNMAKCVCVKSKAAYFFQFTLGFRQRFLGRDFPGRHGYYNLESSKQQEHVIYCFQLTAT